MTAGAKAGDRDAVIRLSNAYPEVLRSLAEQEIG
jgi:hypothetical protein